MNKRFISEHIKPGSTVEGIHFEACYFDNCSAWQSEDPPRDRTVFRRLTFKNCRVWACNLEDTILEDVVIDGLKTGSGSGKIYPLCLSGARFAHVTLRGHVGGIHITKAWSWFDHRPLWRRALGLGQRPKKRDLIVNRSNRAHYAAIDWALDISEARFTSSPRIEGIPAGLIRRDPQTQVVVTRTKAKAMEAAWRSLDISHWGFQLENCARTEWPEDIVLVAAQRSRSFKEDLEALDRLRVAGIAEAN